VSVRKNGACYHATDSCGEHPTKSTSLNTLSTQQAIPDLILMDSGSIRAVRLDGQLSDFHKNSDIVHTLQEEGGLLLKQATNLQMLDSILSENLESTASVTRDVVFNEV